MNTTAFLANVPSQLRYWALHCGMNALPSFCIALWALGLWQVPVAIAAMICAIMTFILLYSTLTSLAGPLSDKTHVLSRALRLGAKIRAWISGLSLLVVFTPAMSITPDFWCGFFSVEITETIIRRLWIPDFAGIGPREKPVFLPVYLATILEGFILSGILFLISFIAVIWLQSRDRRKFFRTACPR
jgi:hypothetical protein